MHARVLIAFLGFAWLAGCASASPSIPSASGSGEPVSEDACPTVSLQSPTGDSIDLTGVWRSPDNGTHYIRQVRSCVWLVGLSRDTGSPYEVGTPSWTNSFFGSMSSDFTIRGSWADVPWGRDDGVGELTFQIEFDEVDGEESITLVVTEATGGFGGEFFLRPEAEVDATFRLEDSEECLAVTDETGEAYELATLPPDWSFGVPSRLFGPNQAEILPSEEFQVSGEVARGTGFCSTGLILFADTINPTPAP